MKLNFFCIGTQKAGTTTIHDSIKNHPDIFLPNQKEANFFDIDDEYKKGITYFHHKYFSQYKGEKIIGNINPNIQIKNKYIERIKESYGPNIKILFMLRDPVFRAFSHYQMSYRRGYEKESFIDALELEDHRISNPIERKNYYAKEPGHFEKNHYSYRQRGLYLKTLKYLYNNFPEQNIKIMFFDNLVNDQESFFFDLYSFLEVIPPKFIPSNTRSNLASTPKSTVLRDILYKDNILKSFSKIILNQNLRIKLKNQVDKLNSKPNPNEKALSEYMVKQVYKLYFSKEIKNIENYLAVNLNSWKHE